MNKKNAEVVEGLLDHLLSSVDYAMVLKDFMVDSKVSAARLSTALDELAVDTKSSSALLDLKELKRIRRSG